MLFRSRNENIFLRPSVNFVFKMWKMVHTTSCPEIQEYGGWNKLNKYCLECLEQVLNDSSSDWCKARLVQKLLNSEKSICTFTDKDKYALMN